MTAPAGLAPAVEKIGRLNERPNHAVHSEAGFDPLY